MVPVNGTSVRSEPYAARRYRDGVKSWRREVRALLAGLFGLPALAAFAWGLAEREPAGLLAGVIAGGFAAAGMILRDSPPSYLESWRRGAEGEQRTGRELTRLGWHFVEDVEHGAGNHDHVLVGPAGVFNLETKFPSGIVEVEDGRPVLRGRHGEDRPAALKVRRQVLGGSARLCRDIERLCGVRTWVSPVVVLWSPFPQRVVETGRVAYVHGSELRRWLADQDQRLDAATVARVAGALTAIKLESELREDGPQAAADGPS
jgi:hypothetical protein